MLSKGMLNKHEDPALQIIQEVTWQAVVEDRAEEVKNVTMLMVWFETSMAESYVEEMTIDLEDHLLHLEVTSVDAMIMGLLAGEETHTSHDAAVHDLHTVKEKIDIAIETSAQDVVKPARTPIFRFLDESLTTCQMSRSF